MRGEFVVPPRTVDADNVITTGNFTGGKEREVASLAVTDNGDGKVVVAIVLHKVAEQVCGDGIIDKKAAGGPVVKVPGEGFDKLLSVSLVAQGKASGEGKRPVGGENFSLGGKQRRYALKHFFPSLGVAMEEQVAARGMGRATVNKVHVQKGGDAKATGFNGG